MLKRKGLAAIITLLLAACFTAFPAAVNGGAGNIDRQEAQGFVELLAREYTAKNHAGFMRLVSQGFRGDELILSNAVRRDFQLLSQVSLRYTVIGVTSITNFAVISVNYQRTVVPLATGQTISDSGLTELAVARENGGLRLYSMKRPLLFGLANSAVATGAVVAGQNQHVIQIARDGTVYVGPVE